MSKTLYILDSYALIYRSYYAFIHSPIINKNGENISAVYGFFNSLLAIFKTYSPCFFLAAFDSKTPTFRHELFDQYKATRQKTPEDLHAQIPIIEEILTAWGIPIVRQDGYEADDIIATVARLCKEENRPCRILSGDKDILQLVQDSISVLKPDRKGGWLELDSSGVFDEWGIRPDQICDYLSLVGDSSDNIPGIKGIGDKTAVKLLTHYDNLDRILAHTDEITGSIGKKIAAGKEDALFSRKLVRLFNTVSFDLRPYECDCIELRYAEAAQLLYQTGALQVSRSFERAAGVVANNSVEAKSADEMSITQSSVAVASPETFESNRELKENTGDYRCIDNEADLYALIEKIRMQSYVAFDCETTSLNTHQTSIVGFSLSLKAGEGFYVPVCADSAVATKTAVLSDIQGDLFVETCAPPDANGAAALVPSTDKSVRCDSARKALEMLFCDSHMTIIMHNGKFDYEVLHTWQLATPTCHFVDTMVAAWLLSPDRPSLSLETLSEVYLSLKTIAFADIVPKGKTFADVPRDVAVQYASEDADLTLQLWQHFEPLLKSHALYDLFMTIEMPLLPLLAEMEIAGIHIEKNQLAQYSSELATQIASIKKDIYEEVGHEFNIASPKQLQEVLFVERKLPTAKKIKTGFSTDTSVLEDLAAVDPVARKILHFRMLTKLKSTYVDALPLLADSEDRIHTSFVQTGTATGRLSSRDPNLQNIPVRDEEGRRIRQAFTARAGYKLISADYSQIELVVLAHLSGDENLREAFRSNSDVHRRTAALIFGVAESDVSADMRRSAKTINFGVMYGMSAFRLANSLGISRTQASEFITSYFATYSGIRAFIDKTLASAETKGYVETILGRRRYIAQINSKNKTEKSAAERIAVNTPIQGSAADIVKKAMINVNAALQSYNGVHLLLQVHDELIVECPDALVDELTQLIRRHMEEAITLDIPLRVSIESGSNWGEFH